MKHEKELELIMELMEELQEGMKYGEDDFSHRLGRKKPEVEIEIKKESMMPLEDEEEMLGEDLDSDMEMGEDPEHAAMVLDEGEEEMSPEASLKARLMKLRK